MRKVYGFTASNGSFVHSDCSAHEYGGAFLIDDNNKIVVRLNPDNLDFAWNDDKNTFDHMYCGDLIDHI